MSKTVWPLSEEENDEEMRELAKEELNECKQTVEQCEQELKILMLPKDPNDDKNVIVEIRGGAGGDEAALFAADLFRMYSKFAERNHWKVEVMSANENGIGGFKEIVFMVIGQGAYSKLKYESGVHRVQRVPIDGIRWTNPYINSNRGNYAGSRRCRSICGS